MALRKLERRNYGGKSPVSIKYQNLHSFKERLILLGQSILETRRITHLHGSARFTIPLNASRNEALKLLNLYFYWTLKIIMYVSLKGFYKKQQKHVHSPSKSFVEKMKLKFPTMSCRFKTYPVLLRTHSQGWCILIKQTSC